MSERLLVSLISMALLVAVGVSLLPEDSKIQIPKEVIPPKAVSASELGSSGVDNGTFRIRYQDPYRPVRVTVPSLSMNALVVPVGMDQLRSVEVPVNIDIVGWYKLGVSPHQQFGSVALVGHRDGAGGDEGVFLRIGELRKGDQVVVTNRDGSENVYEVTTVELMTKERFASEGSRLFAESGPALLTMISCGGEYDRARGGYQSNVVVSSTPIT
jgi:Sortase domain